MPGFPMFNVVDGNGNILTPGEPINADATVGPVPGSGALLFNGTSYDRQRGAQGQAFVTTGGATAVAVASGLATNTVVKASAGRLCRVLLTTANGAAAVSIYDNATTTSGTVIGYIAASAAAGTLVDFQIPAANGITIGGAATNPAMTVTFI